MPVGIDHQTRTNTIAWPHAGRAANCGSRGAILVEGSNGTANEVLIRRAHDHETAAVGRDRGVGALVEDDGVVFDVTVEAETKVTDAAAISTGQVAAHPVPVELVVVGASADADAA